METADDMGAQAQFAVKVLVKTWGLKAREWVAGEAAVKERGPMVEQRRRRRAGEEEAGTARVNINTVNTRELQP